MNACAMNLWQTPIAGVMNKMTGSRISLPMFALIQVNTLYCRTERKGNAGQLLNNLHSVVDVCMCVCCVC